MVMDFKIQQFQDLKFPQLNLIFQGNNLKIPVDLPSLPTSVCV